jgi:hypothetical protein
MTYRTPLVITVLLASLFAGCSKRPTHGVLTSSTSIVIEPGVSIGPVRSGMTMEQVVTALGEPDKKQDGILMYRNLSVFPSNQGFVGHVFCFDSGANGSSTEGFAGHTKEGIGIGSSCADVISAYGEPTATKHENINNENDVMIYESLGLHFHIRNSKVYLIAVYFKI